MTVESASYISQLQTSLPAASDPVSEGDDHIKLIKSVLQTQFPSLGATAMSRTSTELNYLSGLDQNVKAALDDLQDQGVPTLMPSAARDFENSWWQGDGGDTVVQLFYDVATYDDYSNVPWEWGTNVGSLTGNTIALFVRRYSNLAKSIYFNEVLRIAGTLYSNNKVSIYWRGGFSAAGLMADNWARTTTAAISTAQATSGQATGQTAKTEIEESLGCTLSCT